MTTMQQHLTMEAQSQAAQHDDPTPAPVCPSSPEGAMPLQSATLPHKKIPIPNPGSIAATQRLEPRMPRCEACGNALSPSDGKFCKACSIYGRPEAVTLDASNLLPDWKDLDLRPENVWQMKPEPKLESYEGIPAEVINEAGIRGDDVPHVVLEKLEAQMKGKWAMVRFGQMQSMPVEHAPADAREVEAMRWADSLKQVRLQVNPNDFGYILTWEVKPGIARYAAVPSEVCERALTRTALTSEQADKQIFEVQDEALARAVAIEMYLEVGSSIARSVERACNAPVPEEMVNVRGERRPVDEYCVATPVPCTIPSVGEALAMREMVEKAAEVMRGRGAAMPERSFLSLPRQHDSPLSARVVPKGEAPDPKVGW